MTMTWRTSLCPHPANIWPTLPRESLVSRICPKPQSSNATETTNAARARVAADEPTDCAASNVSSMTWEILRAGGPWRDHRVFVPFATIQNWVEAGGKKG